MPIPALIGALGAIAAGGLSHLSARSQQNRAIVAQRSMQAMLANNAGTIMARNAKQAGLSPAFSLANGSIPTASAPSAPSANFDSSGFQSLLGGYAQRKLQRQEEKVAAANAKVAEEKAKQEEIVTKKMQGESIAFDEPTTTVDSNGVVVSSTPTSYLDGAYYQGVSVGELKKAEQEMQRKGFSAQSLEYEVQEGVYNRQKSNPQILDSIASTQIFKNGELQAHAKELLSAARQHDSQALLNDSQRLYVDVEKMLLELKKNEYESGSVDALFKNFSVENLFKWILRNLLDVVNFSGVKKF